LTKGQFSPTSEFGKRTKSTPHGSIDTPFKPLSLILGANPSFVARTIDRNPKHMGVIFERAGHWSGNAFVEVYQNCNIFNDGAFFHLTEKETKKEQVVELTHGEPLIFGANDDKAIMIEGFTPKVVQLADVDRDSLPVHDEKGPIAYHAMLAQMNAENGFPTPVGVIRAVERPVYDELAVAQIETAREKTGKVSIFDELLKGDTWTV
jgi:2-oxoglutarate ferredoxin oxidoreductase subunit beta